MTMTVAQLKTLLQGISGGAFSITADQLGIDTVTTLFQTYLSGTKLTLQNAKGDAGNLTVDGTMSLDELQNAQTHAAFVADSTGTTVSGLSITLSLTGWKLNAPPLQFSLTSVGQYLKSPILVLQAGGNDPDQADPEVLVGGSITIQAKDGTKTETVLGKISGLDPSQSVGFQVQLDGINLGDPSELAQFATGMDFNQIPKDIPVADLLQLQQIAIAVQPSDDVITALSLDVQSAKGLPLVPGKFEISSFMFLFSVLFPATPTEVFLTLGAAMKVGSVEIDVSVSLPDLFFEGGLNQATPLLLKEFIGQFGANTSGIPDDFQISYIQFGINLLTPYNYTFILEIDNLWQIAITDTESLEFQQLRLALSSDDVSKPPSFFIVSQFDVAGTLVYLSASEDNGAWAFSGGTVGYQDVNFVPILNDLASKFHMDGSLLPSSLTALDLQRIDLTFTNQPAQQSKEFTFVCAGQLSISDVTVDASLNLDIKSAGGTNPFEATITGAMTITTPSTQVEFKLNFVKDGTQDLLIGTLHSENTPLDFQELFEALGFQIDIPDGLDISLQDLGVLYQSGIDTTTQQTTTTFILTAKSENYGRALFIAQKKSASSAPPTTSYIFAVEPALSGSLAQIPLIGQKIPESHDLRLNGLQVLLASQALQTADVTAINNLLAQLANHLPGDQWRLADGDLTAKVDLTFNLGVGDTPVVFTLPLGSSSSPPLLAATNPAPPADSTKWLNIQKSLGPLFFRRVGFDYEKGDMAFLLDASLTFSALSISLYGLGISTPLTSFDPHFQLRGMGFDLKSGALEISAAFLSLTPGGLNDENFEYAGEVLVQAAQFSITGLGAYGKFQGHPSFFLFVMIAAPLGGPAFFFVTGLAAGFGYNRSLQIPTLDQLPSFPFVQAAMSSETGNNPFQGKTNDPGAALAVVDQYLKPTLGEDWIAVGLRFTSFELLQSFALLTFAFGTHFEVALLGLSAVTVPTGAPEPVGFAELALEVTFSPDSGVLIVAAQITPSSFILSKACHLTGGFAFYTWFKNVNGASAGDFVVSLGGYHPSFKKPAYYPTVPRLGANWRVSDNLAIKGGLYFALIPSAVMAGGYMDATWQSGNLRAWFNADANFLLSWKPFHYQADFNLRMGASYKLDLGVTSKTVIVHIGVSLSLWGPPFSGRAHVDLSVVSFTIKFGDRRSAVKPISWQDFKASFLPKQTAAAAQSFRAALYASAAATPTDTYCYTQVGAGMVMDLTQRKQHPDDLDWVLSPEKLQLITHAVIPSSQASLMTGSGSQNGGNRQTPLNPDSGNWANNFGVGPVGVANGDLVSTHAITINKMVGTEIDYSYVVSDSCTLTPLTANLPGAPWSKALSLDLVRNPNISAVNSTPSTIAGLLTGFAIVPNVQPPDSTPDPFDIAALQETHTPSDQHFAWSQPTIPSADPFDQKTAFAQLMSTIADPDVAGKRSSILQALQAQGVAVRSEVSTQHLEDAADQVLLHAPLLSYLGEERASS